VAGVQIPPARDWRADQNEDVWVIGQVVPSLTLHIAGGTLGCALGLDGQAPLPTLRTSQESVLSPTWT
jgi:hypothetical protein